MDVKAFFKYFIDNESVTFISNGLCHTEFNANTELNIICDKIFTYMPDILQISQLGLQRSSYKSVNRDLSTPNQIIDGINNIQTIFNFEMIKHVLYRINVIPMLSQLVVNMDDKPKKYDVNPTLEDDVDSQNVEIKLDEWIKQVKTFIKLYRQRKCVISSTKDFEAKFQLTEFYNKYPSCNVKDIINNIESDISSIESDTQNELIDSILILEIKNTITQVLSLIINHSASTEFNVEISDINELVIDNLSTLDVCYDGSFIKLWYQYYLIDPNYEVYIEKFKLRSIINRLNIKMMDYFTSLTYMLRDVFPDYQVTFTTTFTDTYVKIIYDLIIHLSISLLEEKYYDCCINQNNKISFRQLLTAILRLKPKNGEYTQSQITFLHYSLLDNSVLCKGLSNVKQDVDDGLI